MTVQHLLVSIFLPFAIGVLLLIIPARSKWLPGWITLVTSAFNLILAIYLFSERDLNASFLIPVAPFGIDLSLRLYHFSGFIILASAGFGSLISLYSLVFMRGREHVKQFFSYFLLTLAFVNGAVLANNLIALLFFWEGLLVTLFGMIAVGHREAFRTATKAFVIAGATDLCMMLGIAITIHLAKTAEMSAIHLPLDLTGSIAFVLVMIGAISKAGSMPFHSWIPDAAVDSPLPFMALVPAALEKLLGIYLLARITLDLFQFSADAWVSSLMLVVGAVTILLAVMMALVQKDFKRLLSFHAISQVGYMILGIGTAVPVGIVGGLFHMINHAIYKSCLFLTGGAVEKQTGTTDLRKLGGLATTMPVTFFCFVVAAASISGVPPFNGFFSKELVYDGALERGWIFYAAALLGSFLTAASFLKLGHAAFLDKSRAAAVSAIKEAPWTMLVPLLVLAGFCVFFGLLNPIPIEGLILPILNLTPEQTAGQHFSGFPASAPLVIATIVVIVFAVLNHLWGTRKSGSGLGASDHIHHAPMLHGLYDKAEKRWFDPYELGMKLINGFGTFSFQTDRGIDWIYNTLTVRVADLASRWIRAVHTGSHSLYLGWALLGLTFIVVAFMNF